MLQCVVVVKSTREAHPCWTGLRLDSTRVVTRLLPARQGGAECLTQGHCDRVLNCGVSATLELNRPSARLGNRARTIFLFGVSSWPRRSVRCPGRTQPKANRPLKAPALAPPAAGFFFPDRLGLWRGRQRKSMAPLPASPTPSRRPSSSEIAPWPPPRSPRDPRASSGR